MLCRSATKTIYDSPEQIYNVSTLLFVALQAMSAIIAKWGNSLAVRIPQNVAKEMNLSEGVELDLSVVDGAIIIKPAQKRYTIDDLVEGITADNLHAEISSSAPVGNEFW
jgi:antitoxin MazE